MKSGYNPRYRAMFTRPCSPQQDAPASLSVTAVVPRPVEQSLSVALRGQPNTLAKYQNWDFREEPEDYSDAT